ncbi:MAG: MoaD/ThiS family protein [Ornithinibacter sp.]
MNAPQQEQRVVETVVTVRVRYWAGARAAAGIDEEQVAGAATVGALLEHLSGKHPALTTVLPVCSILVEGRAATADAVLPDGAVVEVLPPFAGG